MASEGLGSVYSVTSREDETSCRQVAEQFLQATQDHASTGCEANGAGRAGLKSRNGVQTSAPTTAER